jgi:hypothetical protein
MQYMILDISAFREQTKSLNSNTMNDKNGGMSMIILSECSTLMDRDQRPMPLPHPIGLSDYTHTPLPCICNIQDSLSIHQWCPPSLVNQGAFQPTDNLQVHSASPLVRN